MAPQPTALLALGLCLGPVIHAQDGPLPRPSISAKPGPMITQGSNATILCEAAAGFELFRLETCFAQSCLKVREENSLSWKTEARFILNSVNTDIAGHYRCIYRKSGYWSPRSETLELVVTSVDATQAPRPPVSDSTSPRATQMPGGNSHMAAMPGLKAQPLYILVGVSAGFIVLLLLLLLFCLHRQWQKKHGAPSSRDQEQRPQERASLAVDSPGRAADWATADQTLQQGGEQSTSTPLQGPQEVMYVQLDHRALAQRGTQAVSPPSTAPPEGSSTYAVLARR
ncbi:leukocyte-associated immunoglobulin-like receptor 1 [Heterocephalus glaber]|uniref:Leukocyte-associated immunoglobulin-like receptor 1 n=1 Tax=Heterocephalus glaber TaxID=10181 RepID=A0AAX6QMQ0_HETGA|nr:leukocyte-associated immunoglobulin-like receptor 1 [Heterocephalus glaber]